MNDTYYVEGKFVSADEARIPVNDLLVLRGYGIFDFTRTYNRKPFRLEAHIDRLFYSAEQIELNIHYTREELIAIVQETVARNTHHDESYIRILVTGGDTVDTVTPAGGVRLMVLVTPAKGFPEHCYTDGAKVITVDEPRYLPGVKSLAYIPAVRALKKANAQDAIEALYTDNGYVREGTTSNVFAFFGNKVVTPGQKILAGITRQVVLELIQDMLGWREECNVSFPGDPGRTVAHQRRAMWTFLNKQGQVTGASHDTSPRP